MKIICTILLSLALSLQASAYTVTTVGKAPQWQIDWSYNQTRPDWQEPASGSFENWTLMLVTIEEALQPYVSKDDMLAIFIDDELRGLARPSVVVSTGVVDATQFLLKAYGDESYGDEVVITMKYYNAQLRQVFTLYDTMTLDEDVLYGFDEDFIPAFTLGSAKYPVVTTLDVASVIAGAGVTPAKGDIAAAFVGDECRGVWTKDDGKDFNVFLRKADEAIILKYYDSTRNRVLTFADGISSEIGDADGDGVVNQKDISCLQNYILGLGTTDPTGVPIVPAAADMNGDGKYTIADLVELISLVNGQ